MFKRIFKTDLIHLAVCLVFLCTPIESVGVFGENSSFSIVKLVFLLLMVVWIFSSRKIEIKGLVVNYIVLFLYYLVGLMWSINIDNSFSQLFVFLLPTILMCAIISYNLQNRSDFKRIIIGYLIGCTILSVYAFVMRKQILLNAQYAEMERVTVLGQDANEMAILMDIGIGMLLQYLANERKAIEKIIAWGVILFWSFVIFSTGSRTGSIILVGLMGVYLINNKKKGVYMLPLMLVGIFFVVQYVSEGVLERLLETSESIQSNDFSFRGAIWRNGWSCFMEENIVLGVGYDNFSSMLVKHGLHSSASHNTYLSYFVNGGMIGFLIFLIIVYKFADLVFKVRRIDHKWDMLYYILPIFVGMMTLETTNRRWLFLLGVVLYKYYLLLRKESRQQISINDNNLK